MNQNNNNNALLPVDVNTTINANFRTIDNRLAGVENELTAVENRLTLRITGVDNRLTGVENRLTGVENQLTNVQNSINQMLATLNAGNVNHMTIDQRIALARSVNGTNKRHTETVFMKLPDSQGNEPDNTIWPDGFTPAMLSTMTRTNCQNLLQFYGLQRTGTVTECRNRLGAYIGARPTKYYAY